MKMYKVKSGIRRALLLLLIAAVMVTCTACNRVPQGLYDMKPYIYGVFADGNYEVGISHNGFLGVAVGIPLEDSYEYVHGGAFTSETAAPQSTVSLFGKTFSGEYTESRYWGGSYRATHFYKGRTEELGYYEFGVQEKTGTVMYLTRFWAAPESGTVLSDPELQHLAEEYATQYIRIEDYTMTTSKYDDSTRYEFTKDIDGRETSEYLRISLLTDGTVGSFRMMDVGAYSVKYYDELTAFSDWKIEDLAALTTAEDPNLEIKKIENVRYTITPWEEVVLLADIRYENPGILSNRNYTTKTMAFRVEWKIPAAVSVMMIFAVAVLAVGLTWTIIKRRKVRVQPPAQDEKQRIAENIWDPE